MTVDRDQVLRAAAAQLARRPASTMDEVAKAAGVGRATLHRHFAGREALVRALEELGIRELTRAMDIALDGAESATEALRRLIIETEPFSGLMSFLVSENQLFEGDDVHEGWGRLDQRITELFRRGQEAGEFRIDLSAAWLTEALYGLVGAAAWSVLNGRVGAREYTFALTELLLGGCARRREGG
ncbi:TetR/AcrR family transcriptional regulator [Streptomyces sp. NPDC057638]|uniref:TetR/AcrR family transcriptional regulator n=1 Tax=Streptomyces sp. NPDC057638 TaxID=3346190 RepID=UPI0036B0C820